MIRTQARESMVSSKSLIVQNRDPLKPPRSIVLSVLTLVCAIQMAVSANDLTLSISTNALTEVRGWGLMPAPFDRKLPTYADGHPAHGDVGWLPEQGAEPNAVHRAVCSLGFTVARVYLPPSLGKPNGLLDEARLQDLKDHLTILARGGVTNYVVNLWTPPPHMKGPDRVRYGKYQDRVQRLDPTFGDGESNGLADYIVAVLVRLREAGFRAPSGISIQNEPDVSPIYDGCRYSDTPEAQELYRRVIRQLRAKLDVAGFRDVPVLATESSGAADLEAFFGKASTNGFHRLHSDPQLAAALGGFAWHQYYTVDHVRTFRAAMAAHGAPRWMTEVAQDATPIRGDEMPPTDNEELKVTINMLRRMAADFTDFRVNYWFFWRGWHSTGGKSYPAQDLVFGDAQHANLTQLGQVLRQIWTTVRPGWRVVAVRSSDPSQLRPDNEDIIGGHEPNGNMMSRGTDVLAFTSPEGGRQLVLLVNRWNEARSITRLDGLAGRRARLWLTTGSQTLTSSPDRVVQDGVLAGGPLALPPLSVLVLITSP
jgi:hypothetical protein